MYEEILLVTIAIAGLIIATITDLRTREVPDYLNYFLIASGFVFRFFYSILNNDWPYLLYGVLGFSVAFVLGCALYFTKQWGGGDAKLLMGLGVIFATKPFFIKNDNIFLLNLFLNIFIVGAIFGLIYGIYLAFINKDNFTKEFKTLLLNENIKFIKRLSILVSAIAFIFILVAKDPVTKVFLIGFIIFLFVYIYLWIFVKAVENVCMFKIVPVSKLVEGDWVTEDVLIDKKIVYKQNKLTVDKKDILRFMKLGIKKVKVKDGIPFVPSFLIGTLLTLVLGSLFF